MSSLGRAKLIPEAEGEVEVLPKANGRVEEARAAAFP